MSRFLKTTLRPWLLAVTTAYSINAAPGGFPTATAGETRTLEFHVSTPASQGSFETQTNAALTELLGRNRGAIILKLRVFAKNTIRLTEARAITEKTFAARKLPFPALALVGVAGFPIDGQEVEIESTASSTQVTNPHGVVFLAGLASPTGGRTLNGLARVAHESGVAQDGMVRVSCFYESSEQMESARKAIGEVFPKAESAFVWSYASAPKPAIECEGVGRIAVETQEPIRYVNFAGEPASPNFSRAAAVTTRRVVFTGTEAANDSEEEIRKALERLSAGASRLAAKLTDVVMADNYWLNDSARDRLRTIRAKYYGKTVPAATGVVFTALEGGGAAALELVIAIPDVTTLAVGDRLIDGTNVYKSHLARMVQSVAKDGAIVQSRAFNMDKFATERNGVPVFRLLIDSFPDDQQPKFHSETILDLRNMALVHREDETEGGIHRVIDVEGAHVTGYEQSAQDAEPKRFDFVNEVPSFYSPFVDAAVNATTIRGDETYRVATFDTNTRKTEWHTYRVTGTDTVLVQDRKVTAWIIQEDDQPRYTIRKIWLIKEPPFFPMDETFLRDGSVRRVEQTLVKIHP